MQSSKFKMQNDNSKFKIKPKEGSYPIDGGFLQSDYWKNFQEKLNRKVIQIKESSGDVLMIFHELPIVGGYFFVPRCSFGEITNYKHQKTNNNKIQNSNAETFFRRMTDVTKGYNLGWIRVEPQTDKDLETIKSVLGKEYKIVKSKKNHEPAQTLMLDLNRSENDLLEQMKQKTRYNIRLATKKGVEVFQSREASNIEKFIELTKETAKRDGIVPHPDEYYRKMAKNIPEDVLKIYFAKFDGKFISAIMVSFYGLVATYLHGASGDEHRNMMSPFALQWKAMRDAKKKGCEKYDLGGTRLIKKNDNWLPENGSWKGITKFKQGFCPNCQPVEFPGCWDIVIDSKKYFLYRFLQKAKDILKNKSIFSKKSS